MSKAKVVIIGAGPTGLGAAYRLKELGEIDFLILDGASQVGGLATSYRDPQGFVWDIGGHVQFSHYEYFDELMMRALGGDGWFRHERESWVWMRDRFIPYPFQNNLRHLPKEEMWKCIEGLVEITRNPRREAPGNFRQWIHATFGLGLADVFMEPYNFKVWAYPPEELSFEWIGERVAVTDLGRVLKNILFEQDDLSWGPNNTFQFPKQGGTGAVWEKVADLVGREKIRLQAPVQSIQAAQNQVVLRNGERVGYDRLLNTMPLDTLVGCVEGLSPSVRDAGRNLKYSTSNILGVGLEGPKPEALQKKCWMYFPENNCPFYRVTIFSNYSMHNVPEPRKQWSLLAEVSESGAKPVDQVTLMSDVIEGMRRTKLITGENRIVSRWQYRAVHGYPTPFLGRNELLSRIHGELEPLGISSRGRFGGWKYEVSNQDHSLMQGVEWVDWMLTGKPELTYVHPAKANAGKQKR